MSPAVLDIRTIFFLTTFVALAAAFAMLSLWRTHRDDESLRLWTYGTVLAAAGYLLIGLRGSIPVFLSVPIANMFIAAGHGLFLVGIDRYAGKRPRYWSAMAAGGIILFAYPYFTYVDNNMQVRMGLQFVVLGILSIAFVHRLWQAQVRCIGAARLATTVVFLSFGATLLVRVAAMARDVPHQNLFAPSLFHAFVFTVTLLFYATVSFCFVALLYGRQRAVMEERSQALAASEEHYHSIADHGQALIWMSGPDKGCTYFNRPWLAFTGRTLAQEQGDGWTEGVHPDDLPSYRDTYAKAVDRREEFSMVYRLRRRDGQYRWILDDGTPRYDAAGSFLGYVGHCLDITDRKEMEEELRRHRQDLEKLVDERTAELAQAKGAAEAASRAKSMFLANTSHELRTPLNAVLGFAQLMARDEHLSPDQRHYLETINRSGQHLLAVINDILEISRIESGKLQSTLETVSPAGMLQSLVTMLSPAAAGKRLDLTLEIAAPLPGWVRTDAHKLQQILLTLVSNALQYTDRGEVVLRATATEESGIVRLGFVVADTGVGIAPGDIEHIFEPFYLTEHGIRRQGTGLGLPLSHRYVELLGGHLAVESTPGKGSVFRFEIPVEIATAPPAVQSSLPPRIAATTEVRILVVDDDEDQRLLTRRLLRDSGFALREAASGQEALRLFQEWRPQLILMDMRMPGMDGIEATRRIRTLPGGDRVAVIALTASAFEEQRAEFIAAGCDEVAIKPVELNKVLALLASHLDSGDRNAATNSTTSPCQA